MTDPAAQTSWPVFVYGSLKRGCRNHAAYCRGYASLRSAKVVGRLYRQADGYPMLVVPRENVIAIATGQLPDDWAQLKTSPARKASWRLTADAAADWQEISGDLMHWDADHPELANVVRRLDKLEDFYPEQPSLYHRALVPVIADGNVELAWTYIAPAGNLPDGAARMGNCWTDGEPRASI